MTGSNQKQIRITAMPKDSSIREQSIACIIRVSSPAKMDKVELRGTIAGLMATKRSIPGPRPKIPICPNGVKLSLLIFYIVKW